VRFFDGVEVVAFDHTQLVDLVTFINDTAKVLVGFNNVAYDDPLLRAISEQPAKITMAMIYETSGVLIADHKTLTAEQRQRRNRLIYGKTIWAYSIDLFEVNNRKASLKEYQCRLGWSSVAESPVEFDKAVTIDDISLIGRYNLNDVMATSALLGLSIELIEIRHKISVHYGLSHEVYVKGDAKIAEYYMIVMIIRKTGGDRQTLKRLADASPNNRASRFTVTELLPPVVTFSTAIFQNFFQRVSGWYVERLPTGKFELVTDLPGNQAVFNGVTLRFGCGGLHSDDEAGVFHDDEVSELWDVDVTSYYPTLMIEYGIKPEHVLSVFTTELKVLREARVAAKKAGDKLTADALKLIINSLFGKLGDTFSPLRDDRACMQVTIGGQFLLMMLIEMVHVAGATVLSVNTDGLLLRVPKEKAETIYVALRTWESRTSLTLEEQAYRTVARRDVNNFVAISTKKDQHGCELIKSKGVYSADTTKRSGRIVPLAVQEHLRTGASIAEVINKHTEPLDFLFYQRAQSDGHFSQGEQRLPRTIRWYVARDSAEPIHRVSINGKSSTTVPHAHHAQLVQELPEHCTLSDLPDLNRQYYIKQAQKLLSNALASVEVERGTQQAHMLQEMGLTLLPQYEGKNPRGISLDDMDSICTLANRRCERWAVVTGAMSETLVLDLDKPDKLEPKLSALLKKHPTLTTWHGDGTADDVRNGLKRGAITYRYEGQDARIGTRATNQWVEKYGFEIAFGKKVQTVIGQHLSAGDDYVQDGTVADAPAELIEYLGLRLGQPRKLKTISTTVDTESSDRLLQAADEVLGIGWAQTFTTHDRFHGVEGATPGHEKAARLRLWVRGGRVGGHTFHVTYDIRGTVALVQSAYDRLRPDTGQSDSPSDPNPSAGPDSTDGAATSASPAHLDRSDVPPLPNSEDQRMATDCAQGFEQISKIGVIIGTTGTGKSWQATKRAMERHLRSERTMLVVADKEAIEQLRRYLLGHWASNGHEVKDLRMQILTSTSVTDEVEVTTDDTDSDGGGNSRSGKTAIKKGTMIVITHHHFASRKPLTTKLYSALSWVAEHAAEVILDEGDLYIERQNQVLQLDARYRMIGGVKHGQWARANHCPSVKGIFRCKECTKRSGGSVTNLSTHHAYNSAKFLKPSQFEHLAPEEFELRSENLPVEKTIDLPGLNLRLSKLAQTPGYLAQRLFNQGNRPPKSQETETELSPKQEMLIYLRDVIDCAHLPTLAEPRLVNDHQQIVEDDPHRLALSIGLDGKPLIDNVCTATWKFPYFVCQSRFLLLYDRAAVFYMMQHAHRFIIMSATIGEQHLAFLRDCANGNPVVVVTIPTPTRKPLDHVVIIGHQGSVDWKAPLGERDAQAIGCNYDDVGLSNRSTIERLGNALSTAGKPPLVFMPTKKESIAVFSHMKERGWSCYIEGEYRVHADQAVTEEKAIDGSMALVSYARSSIGTGANLPKYDVVVVDGTVSRPHYLFNPSLKTEDAYLEAQEGDRVRIMIQNIGRILRGSGMKFIFVVGITPTQLTRLTQETERLATTKTASWFTGSDTVTAMAALVASVKARALVVPIVAPKENKSRSQQSHKQRALEDVSLASGAVVDRSQATFAVTRALVETLARDGVTWRTASRRVNANRLSATLFSELKAAFMAAQVASAVDGGSLVSSDN
jgi:hypothetical protein